MGRDRSRASEAGVHRTVEWEPLIHCAVPSVERLSAKKQWRPKRENPEVVTEGPAEDAPEVYGAEWPLVDEWRRMREEHPYQGKHLSWLLAQERLLVLELAMLEEHGLKLPPETQPLRGFGRRGPDPMAPRGPPLHTGGLAKAENVEVGTEDPEPGTVVQVGGEGGRDWLGSKGLAWE